MIIYDYERNKRNTTKKNSLFTTCAVFMYSRLLILVVHCHHSALFGLPSWPSFYNLFFWRHIFCVIQSVQWCSTHLLFWVNKNCKAVFEGTPKSYLYKITLNVSFICVQYDTSFYFCQYFRFSQTKKHIIHSIVRN